MFALHAIQAEFGDCLLLEYGAADAPRFILIDGGPPDTFDNHLRGVLQTVVRPRGLERVILSHVDNDHVVGLLDLFAELRQQAGDGVPPLVSVGGVWHNSFGRALDPQNTLAPRAQGLLGLAGLAGVMAQAAEAVNGIGEGNRLRQFALLLRVPLNPDGPELITVDSMPQPLAFANLRLTVVGPTQENLDELREEWKKWLDRHEEAIGAGNLKVMSNADQSVPNLSSICVLAEADGRSVLLTGDARSDHLLAGLKARGRLDASGRAHFDLIKLMHHGSDRNVTKTFFQKITADRYLISANGENKNPDLATLIWLVTAAKEQNRHPEIIVTNRTPSTDKIVQEYPPAEYGYTLRIMPSTVSSLRLKLA